MRRLRLSGSTSIAELGYDPIDRDLEVRFHGTPNKIYRYRNVPARTYLAILASKSFGSYLAKNVKGTYEFDVSDAPIEAVGLSVRETFQIAADLRLAIEAAFAALALARHAGAPAEDLERVRAVVEEIRRHAEAK